MTKGDIADAVRDNSMDGLPVKIEHKGVAVGKVVTSWINNGKMDLLIEVDERIFEGNIVSRFVRDGVVNDLSLGYNVGLQFSEQSQTYVAAKKTYNEVSIVRTGARNGCHINGYSVVDTEKKKTAVSTPARNVVVVAEVAQAAKEARMIVAESDEGRKRHKRNEFDRF